MSTSAFSSVKLSATLVAAARQSATPMRRSVASQIEYWATLGQVVEHSGLTVQEAQTAIENYEAAARGAAARSDISQADELIARFSAIEVDGSLAQRVRMIVAENASKAAKNKG